MYYQERKTIVSVLEGIALLTVYCIYVFGKISSGAVGLEDLKFFAVTMLVFTGIGAVATILIQILFHILFSVSVAVRERDKDSETIGKSINSAMVEDERDKLIDLKSTRIAFIVAMAGFIGGLALIALGYEAAMMLNVLYIAVSLGAIGEGVAKLVYYRIR